ncbi:MAG: sulfotransferase [Desulfobulbaceae bacterium]|nr:sulfotransferase [Desulfobulbaceae bacterium]
MGQPLFIVGYGRSGTTLLRSVLEQHSAVRLINEPELIFALRNAGYRTEDLVAPEKLRTLVLQLSKIGLCKNHLHSLPAEIVNSTCSATPLSFREIYEKLLPVPSVNVVWGEKSLNNIFFVQEILDMYPGARFVEIVRDPRSVCLSYLVKRKKADSESSIRWFKCLGFTAEHLLLWREWIRAGQSAKKQTGDSRWLTVSYECFLNDPRSTLDSICNLVGISFEPSMLDHEQRGNDQVFSSRGAFAHQNIKRPFDVSRISAYKKLPVPLLALAERLVGNLMDDLGYERETIKLSFLQIFFVNTALGIIMPGIRKKVSGKVSKRLI